MDLWIYNLLTPRGRPAAIAARTASSSVRRLRTLVHGPAKAV
jgi:hypothetical protein